MIALLAGEWLKEKIELEDRLYSIDRRLKEAIALANHQAEIDQFEGRDGIKEKRARLELKERRIVREDLKYATAVFVEIALGKTANQ